MNASHKWLKASLAPGVKKLGPAFLASKLGEFPIFDGFLDLADFLPSEFLDLDNISLSNLPIFGSTRFDPSLDPSPLLPPTLPTALVASTCDDMVVFSIDVSGAAILLKPLMNQQ